MTRLRHAAALLAVAALLGVAGCGESDSATPPKSEGGKATSTPDKKQSGPYGY